MELKVVFYFREESHLGTLPEHLASYLPHQKSSADGHAGACLCLKAKITQLFLLACCHVNLHLYAMTNNICKALPTTASQTLKMTVWMQFILMIGSVLSDLQHIIQ